MKDKEKEDALRGAARHSSTRRERAVVVMARAPKAGTVKTRLCPPLTVEEAAVFYECLLHDSLRKLGSSAAWDLWIAYTPGSRGYFQGYRKLFFRLLQQRGGSLGARMHALFRDLFDLKYRSVILLGSDIPGITIAAIDQACQQLAVGDRNVVLGPADDGGYYLIGLTEPCDALFRNIAWSTADVLEQTLAQVTEQGLRVSTVQSTYDVDRASDLERLWVDVRNSNSLQLNIPRTYQWLRAYYGPV